MLFLVKLLFALRPPTSDGANRAPGGQHEDISYHRFAILAAAQHRAAQAETLRSEAVFIYGVSFLFFVKDI